MQLQLGGTLIDIKQAITEVKKLEILNVEPNAIVPGDIEIQGVQEMIALYGFYKQFTESNSNNCIPEETRVAREEMTALKRLIYLESIKITRI